MGQLAIPSSATVYIDTSVVIYTIEVKPDYWALLQPLWLKFQTGEIEIITSELTLMEVLVIPLRNADSSSVSAYEQLLLSTELQLVPISQSVLREAARLRAATNLRTPDAIHAATALAATCSLFLTNDYGLRNASELPAVILDEVLNA